MPEVIRQIKVNSSTYELLPKYIQDNEGAAKTWSDITQLITAAKLKLIIVSTLPTASEDTMGAIYLIDETGTTSGTYTEYITLEDHAAYFWEKIGTTETDLSDYVKKGTYVAAAGSAGAHTHSVTGSVQVPTVSSSNAKLAASASGTSLSTSDAAFVTGIGTPSTASALGTAATFTTTVTPAVTNIKATATGASISTLDGSFVTDLGTPSTATALGTGATFITSVIPSTTNIKATASGAAISTSDASFVTSYPGSKSNLVTTSITPVNGTANVSSVTISEGTAPSLSQEVVEGVLNITFNAGTTPSIVEASTVTVAVASSALDVATGALNVSGNGASVLVGLGTPSTATAITSASVSAQPTIALSSGATPGTGVISITTGISSATTSVDSSATVTAITGITPSKASAITSATVSAQPTIALASGAAAGSGVISVATGISTAATTISSTDTVAAITGITPTTDNALVSASVASQPTIALTADASEGVSYVAGISVGTTTATVTGTASEAGSHVHDVAFS